MIGDSYEDDIEGARALGLKAFLLDRDGRCLTSRIVFRDLLALPAALGLTRSSTRPTSGRCGASRPEGAPFVQDKRIRE